MKEQRAREKNAEEVRASGSGPIIPSLDALPEAVIAVTADLRICYWNRAAETIFALAPDKALGRDLVDAVIAPDRAADVRESLRDVVDGGRESFELACRRLDGTPVYAD